MQISVKKSIWFLFASDTLSHEKIHTAFVTDMFGMRS
jgi:hypothetical protein